LTAGAFAHFIAVMTEREKLLQEIDGFLATAGMAESTFGRKAVNDGKLVARLRAGSTVTLDTASKVRACIATARAAGLPPPDPAAAAPNAEAAA